MLNKELYVNRSKLIDKVFLVKSSTVKCCSIHSICSNSRKSHTIISCLKNSHLISSQPEDLYTSLEKPDKEKMLLISFLRKQRIQLPLE